MPSRLSSLLVRDGLVGIKRMERVFQRQVIYGGALDTILLEMGLVPEERLVEYLSLATGLPPATRDETEVFDADAVKSCPEPMAKEFGVVPLSFSDGALRVLVRDPVDLDQLESLANELDRPVQPLVVTEYRYHVVFDRAFGRETDARFAALAKKAAETTPTKPVGKATTVIVETTTDRAESEDDHVVVDVGLPPSKPAKARTKTMALSTDALKQHLEQTEDQRVEAEKARGGTPPKRKEPAAEKPARAPSEPIPKPAEREETAVATRVDEAAPTQPMPAPDTPLPEPEREPPPPRRRHSVDDTAPLDAAAAREALESAEERDLIFSILLRAVRSRVSYAGLLTIQGQAAIGRIAIDGDEIEREQISQVLIPVDDARAVNQAVQSAAPYIGPIATGDDEIDAMVARMGGLVPPSVLLLPIALRNRVVAVVVGHRGTENLSAADVSDLLPLATVAAEALSRLIMKAKAVGYRKAEPAAEEAAPSVDIDDMPTKKTAKADKANWSAPADDEAPAEVDFGSEVSIEAGEPNPIGELLDVIESGDDAAVDVIEEAVNRADETLEVLRDRFPGKLEVDRYELGGRILRPSEHGPLLDLVVQLGAAAADLLVELLAEPNRETRYYATLCLRELKPRSALTPLVERLFDTDYGIRSVAIDALRGYPVRELDKALEFARHALHSEDAKRVQAAADAAAELDDVAAIPDLLDANQRNDDGSPYARRALITLTKQNLGSSNRKWRSWWKKHKNQHRIEWLIEGLSHKEEAIRQSAAEDLRRITGEYFGFHHDMSKKEREQARDRWQQWWNETGRRRFLRSEPGERHRPTAVLPARRE